MLSLPPRSCLNKLMALTLASAGVCFSQAVSAVTLSNGVELRVGAQLGTPTGEEILSVELAPASGNSFYRIFRDQNKAMVYAYELKVDRAAQGTMQMSAQPAGNEFAAQFPNADGGKPVPTISGSRDLPLLHSGERTEIGLFEIPGMGLKVSDTIQIKLSQFELAGDGATAADADASSSDELHFSGLKVSVDGKTVPAPGPSGAVSGRYAMFYIPGRGGYFFSTQYVAGTAFVKAGSIDGNHMHFELNNEVYDCASSGAILGGSGTGEVWAYHDPGYKPVGNWTSDLRNGALSRNGSEEFFTAASDSLSWWVR